MSYLQPITDYLKCALVNKQFFACVEDENVWQQYLKNDMIEGGEDDFDTNSSDDDDDEPKSKRTRLSQCHSKSKWLSTRKQRLETISIMNTILLNSSNTSNSISDIRYWFSQFNNHEQLKLCEELKVVFTFAGNHLRSNISLLSLSDIYCEYNRLSIISNNDNSTSRYLTCNCWIPFAYTENKNDLFCINCDSSSTNYYSQINNGSIVYYHVTENDSIEDYLIACHNLNDFLKIIEQKDSNSNSQPISSQSDIILAVNTKNEFIRYLQDNSFLVAPIATDSQMLPASDSQQFF
jgi:hypothetical protein